MLVLEKIISFFMSILMALFPNVFLQVKQERDNDFNLWAPKIIEAIKEEDVEALESMMCLNIRQNVENLHEEIQNFYDCIEGEIIDAYGEKDLSWVHDDGTHSMQYGYSIYLTTDKHEYEIGGVWELYNTINPEETKIRVITLVLCDEPSYAVYSISDVEDELGWH